ncbi:MAG: hypothetical protein IPM17_08350 [Verrucomicrobia bacterium]|nr:hypothetical protein [Verrucomicrobiota bacterium]
MKKTASDRKMPGSRREGDAGRLRFATLMVALALWLPAVQSADPPPDPWAAYNAGVAAYARKDYTNALQRWEDLSLQRLPRGLRGPVWFQLGNTQFRLGEPLEPAAPDDAAEWWRRSREAFRAALVEKPRDAAARHNLTLVERRLSRLLHRLGREALDAADGKPVSDAIELLRDSTQLLHEASEVAPADVEIRSDFDRAVLRLQQALIERAALAERRGDESAQQNNAWADRAAEREYRAALEDLDAVAPARPFSDPSELRSAPSSEPPSPSAIAQEAGDRVARKLADLLTRVGQREQREGTQLSEWNPDEALDVFEAALRRFTDALELQAEHAAAAQGAREVRAAMEKLLVQEGQSHLREGREQLARQIPAAARSLETALSRFEEALAIRPTSVPAQNGADEARSLLPAALALVGRTELQAGDRAEAHSPTAALGHYQQAENDFQQALELAPSQPAAREGLAEVQPKLARLRERIAQDAAMAAQRLAQNRPSPTLDSLLGEVQERERPRNDDRQRQSGRKNLGTRRTTLDW